MLCFSAGISKTVMVINDIYEVDIVWLGEALVEFWVDCGFVRLLEWVCSKVRCEIN